MWNVPRPANIYLHNGYVLLNSFYVKTLNASALERDVSEEINVTGHKHSSCQSS